MRTRCEGWEMYQVPADKLPQVFTGLARTKKGAEHLASDAAMRYIAAIPPKSVSSSPSGMAPVHFTSASSPMNTSPNSGPQYQPAQYQTLPQPQKVRCQVILHSDDHQVPSLPLHERSSSGYAYCPVVNHRAIYEVPHAEAARHRTR